MTISNTISRVVYNGNDATTAFNTTFVFGVEGEIVVTLVDSSGVETVQTLTTHYTVSGGSGSTGTVTMVTAPATGEELVLQRVTDRTQETDYPEGGTFPAESHEDALDKLTKICQEIEDDLSRAIKLPITTGNSDLEIPEPEASKILAWNSGATALENVDPTDVGEDLDAVITAAAKGDILAHNGTAWVNMGVGSNDEVLIADSAEAEGVKWGAAASGVAPGVLSKSSDYTIVAGDLTDISELIVLVDASGADVTITLPTPATYEDKLIRIMTAVDPTGNEVIVHKSGATEWHTGYILGDYFLCTSDGTTDEMLDHKETMIARIYINTDESVATEASEKMTSTTAALDTAGAWASDEYTAPCDAYAEVHWAILNDGNPFIIPELKINGSYVVNATCVASTGSIGKGAEPVNWLGEIDSGQDIEFWGRNRESDAANNVCGDAAGDESMGIIKLTRRYS